MAAGYNEQTDVEGIVGYTIGSSDATLTTTIPEGDGDYYGSIAEDKSGNLYILVDHWNGETDTYSIQEYAATANGQGVSPIRTITLPNTVIDYVSIALDKNGNVFASVEVTDNEGQVEIMMFSPTNQTSVPDRVVLTNDEGYLATDANANVYLADYSNSIGYEVVEYVPGLANSTPVRTIALADWHTRGLALDLSGNVYVSGYQYNNDDDPTYSIEVFSPTDTTTPSRTISGSIALGYASSISVDATGAIFVVGRSTALPPPPPPPVVGGPQPGAIHSPHGANPADSGANSVLKFAAGANGNIAPVATYNAVDLFGSGLVLQ